MQQNSIEALIIMIIIIVVAIINILVKTLNCVNAAEQYTQPVTPK